MLSLEFLFWVNVDVKIGSRYRKIVNFNTILTPFSMGFPAFYEVARPPFRGPLVAILGFAGGAPLQAVSRCRR